MGAYLVKHHRKCKSNGGKNNKGNISWLPYSVHVAWHILFRNWEASRIAEVINEQFIDPDWKLVVKKRRK